MMVLLMRSTPECAAQQTIAPGLSSTNSSNRATARIFPFLILGAGVTPAEGSVKPIAGFTFD
jgi:hypothetical protein